MKILFIVLVTLLFLVFNVQAELDECSRHGQLTNEIPCKVISSWKPSMGCDGVPVFIYQSNGTLRQEQSWNDSTPFCEFIWNVSSPIGSYIYNSSIEDGVLTLEAEDNMLSITFSFILFISIFSIIGWVNRNNVKRYLSFLSYALALVELMMLVGVIWMGEAGNPITGILRLNFIIMLIIGGGIGLVSLFLYTIREADITEVFDDQYNSDSKWREDDKWLN